MLTLLGRYMLDIYIQDIHQFVANCICLPFGAYLVVIYGFYSFSLHRDC